MLQALNKQLRQDAPLINTSLHSIYFGGGTPSLLSASELKVLLETIHKHYSVSGQVEITLEANPDDISIDKANQWLKLGINRLSIGIQSFHEQNLRTMNRAHNAKEAHNAIEIVKNAGFTNYSVDLIFALPDLTDEMWIQNLNKIIASKVPHLSCYNLTIEEQTALSKLISDNKIAPLTEKTSIRQFNTTMDLLQKSGYEQYEISNYCLPTMESKHNSAYWDQTEYLGIGPSAHSYLGKERSLNVAHNMKYIQAIEMNLFKREVENRSLKNEFNEHIMIRLRTSKGIDSTELVLKYNKFYEQMQRSLAMQIKLGSVSVKNGVIKLTKKGKFIADQVAMELFAK
jgi:oxygen-independent coproporphyrinogen-3 oxidase